ncbi:hypothetical protein NDU88_002345 [Pleurodeles waltl]|uniref:Uncharacterized protein n=1 Tax=Pleurodeles waltl TaxID=8319 RepID=A0AAV7WKY6_PLEWA|nr:hypothetical protein NDU88_002345 [Pleurodeles waltl]
MMNTVQVFQRLKISLRAWSEHFEHAKSTKRSRWWCDRTCLWSASTPRPGKTALQPRDPASADPDGFRTLARWGVPGERSGAAAEELLLAGPIERPRPQGPCWSVGARPLAGTRLGGIPISGGDTEGPAAGARGLGPGGAQVKRAGPGWEPASGGTDRATEVKNGGGVRFC